MALLIKEARLIDPSRGVDAINDILIKGEKISEVGPDLLPAGGVDVIDCTGKIVCPGLIDMHTHLREPGREDKETIATGMMAAAAGGFTTIACMPNTSPVNDTASVTEYILGRAKVIDTVRVLPVGSITKGLRGESLSEIGELKAAGAAALSDDGMPVMNADLMRNALDYAGMFDLLIISHCEDKKLAGDGVMNEGRMSTRLGLSGIPSAAEEIMVAREICLARLTKRSVHIAHVSTAGSVRLIRQAKAEGLPVTAEVTPHHLCLTEEAVAGFDPNTKVNPPLRTKADQEALIEGLQDGTIDVIASDHAPHTLVEKELEYDYAPFGIIGMETSLPLILTRLYHKGILNISQIIEKMSCNPARILKIDPARLAPGDVADITVIDPEKEKIVDVSAFRSKARNCPFHGWPLKGYPSLTIYHGKITFNELK
ncbi:dihydroorotase [bacterium]|nr:dihydroorotase [bacterium]